MTATALDRYKAAKTELDAFDAFAKLVGPEGKPSGANVSAEGSLTWKSASGHYEANPVRHNVGLNKFIGEVVLRDRAALFTEYRERLVAAVASAKQAADAEALQTIRETAPQ